MSLVQVFAHFDSAEISGANPDVGPV